VPITSENSVRADAPSPLRSSDVEDLLGLWLRQEVSALKKWRELRRVKTEELEDIYQEVAIVLLKSESFSADHLRNKIRKEVRLRALKQLRDGGRREEIHAELARTTAASTDHARPETEVLVREDRAVAAEFLAELDHEERITFYLMADGMSWNRIAKHRQITPAEAHRIVRRCTRKHEKWLTLYRSGRLCGYRADTLRSLRNDEATSDELAQRAIAHLDSCLACQWTYRTNAEQLRARFRREVAAFAPAPGLLGYLTRLMRDSCGASGRAALRGGTAKLAVGGATVALVTGGLGATGVLSHHRTRRQLVNQPATASAVTKVAHRPTASQEAPPPISRTPDSRLPRAGRVATDAVRRSRIDIRRSKKASLRAAPVDPVISVPAPAPLPARPTDRGAFSP
jgi:hypothetical protein